MREHVDFMRMLPIGSYDFTETFSGGASVYNDIFNFHTNGSIKSVFHLPNRQLGAKCQRITSDLRETYLVAACQ